MSLTSKESKNHISANDLPQTVPGTKLKKKYACLAHPTRAFNSALQLLKSENPIFKMRIITERDKSHLEVAINWNGD